MSHIHLDYEDAAQYIVRMNKLRSQEALIGENLKSPTPAINTVLMQRTKAAVTGRKVTVFDVGQAFLNSYLRKDVYTPGIVGVLLHDKVRQNGWMRSMACGSAPLVSN